MHDDDAWQPSATIAILKKRAKILQEIRQFFVDRGYLEIETPLLAKYGVTDVYLNNLKVNVGQQEAYLQTSPEYHMKRLLAAGSGPIFQICKAFRDDEQGRLHNREFSLLEWYRPSFDHIALMDEVDALLQCILKTEPAKRMTYQQAFIEACNIDPLNYTQQQLHVILHHQGLGNVLSDDEHDSNQAFYLLMSHVVEAYFAELDCPVFIYDFPKTQASLARCRDDVASRFEVYYQGIELANGFHELSDPFEQRKRFDADNHLRQQLNLPRRAIDERLIAALEAGLPDCAGVALGLDRLCLLALQQPNISDVLSFSAHNS